MLFLEEIIKDYLENYFEPTLAQFTVNDETILKVSSDIHSRLSSILNRWNNSSFRSTILLHGIEEAYYYEPQGDIEIKSLIVVAIRNSLLEDLASTNEAAIKYGLRRPIISDEQIKHITSNAIIFFTSQNFESSKYDPDIIKNDPFIELPTKFPLAWYVMHKLSQCNNYLTFETPKELKTTTNPIEVKSSSRVLIEIQSGMDLNLNHTLSEILTSIKDGKQPFFFSDSFKMITRHPEKLFRVIEEVLKSNAPIVTFNYYISIGYVSKRRPFLKVSHSEKDLKSKFKYLKGLRKTHLKIIKNMS